MGTLIAIPGQRGKEREAEEELADNSCFGTVPGEKITFLRRQICLLKRTTVKAYVDITQKSFANWKQEKSGTCYGLEDREGSASLFHTVWHCKVVNTKVSHHGNKTMVSTKLSFLF